jgi:hypothetical protein
MIISTPIFEAYLKCPSKCWFLFFGKEGDSNIYPDFVRNQNNAYRAAGIERLMVKIRPSECVITPSVPVNIKTAKWLLAVDLAAIKEPFSSRIHAVERVPSNGQGKPVQFIPIRFIFTSPKTWGVYEVECLLEGKRFRFGNHPVRQRELSRQYGEARPVGKLYEVRIHAKEAADLLNGSVV